MKEHYNKKKLPRILRKIKRMIKYNNIENYNEYNEGQINSYIDEKTVIDIIKKNIPDKNIWIPHNNRHWFDIAVKDKKYGWIPINIKSTTMETADRSAGLLMLIHSLTNYELDIKKNYRITKKLTNYFKECIINDNWCKKDKKDYYFLVINKNDNKKVIINSLKGLTVLTSNPSNRPFLVNWKYNDEYIRQTFEEVLTKILNAMETDMNCIEELCLFIKKNRQKICKTK